MASDNKPQLSLKLHKQFGNGPVKVVCLHVFDPEVFDNYTIDWRRLSIRYMYLAFMATCTLNMTAARTKRKKKRRRFETMKLHWHD